MKNKRGGVIGSFLGLFVMTIIVVLILLVFIFMSGFIKKVNKVDDDFVVLNEEKVGIFDVFDYQEEYDELVNVRFYLNEVGSVDEALGKGVLYAK